MFRRYDNFSTHCFRSTLIDAVHSLVVIADPYIFALLAKSDFHFRGTHK